MVYHLSSFKSVIKFVADLQFLYCNLCVTITAGYFWVFDELFECLFDMGCFKW
jgi:hypothetical protein